jgi:hypothetical protein
MLPPMKVIKNVYCKLLFNTETKGFINPGWYSSWYPAQLAAEYAIKSLMELDSNSTYNYIEALLSSHTNKEINQLIEYLVFYWLAWSSSIMHSLGMPRTLNYIQLPP